MSGEYPLPKDYPFSGMTPEQKKLWDSFRAPSPVSPTFNQEYVVWTDDDASKKAKKAWEEAIYRYKEKEAKEREIKLMRQLLEENPMALMGCNCPDCTRAREKGRDEEEAKLPSAVLLVMEAIAEWRDKHPEEAKPTKVWCSWPFKDLLEELRGGISTGQTRNGIMCGDGPNHVTISGVPVWGCDHVRGNDLKVDGHEPF